MDNMAYLHQISTDPRNKPTQNNSSDILSKIFTIRNGIIAALVVAFIVVFAIVAKELNKVDNKDQDLLVQSWWQSHYMIETIDDYSDYIKSSQLRSMTSSYIGAMKELMYNDQNLLLNEYGIDVEDLEEGDIAMTELETNNKYKAILEDAHLNGHFDRTFVRETALQIAYAISYQSGCSLRAKKDSVVEATSKSEANLNNIYEQFNNYKDLSN